MTKKIRWTIAHEPAELFIRTAEAFRKELHVLSNGEWEVETILGLDRSFTDIKADIREGKLEMAQFPVGQVYLGYLNWPYLFRDHTHATNVLEGEIGQNMLSSLRKNGFQGLAFTYSGGFRIFVSDKTISSLSDIREIKITCLENSFVTDSLHSMGLQAEQLGDKFRNVDGQFAHFDFPCEAAETTYTRYLSHFPDKKNIAHTEHSLFLTTIIASNQWFDSLSAEDRAIILEAAKNAARLEREWSNQDTDNIRNRAEELGLNIYDLTEEETAELKTMAANFKVSDPFPNKMIELIRSA